jgi:histidinol-phosphatase (PHP family)
MQGTLPNFPRETWSTMTSALLRVPISLHDPDERWRASLHGGHSGEFCDHAGGTLRELLDAAQACGYRTFGVTEHAPRTEERFLYDEERAMGWGTSELRNLFDAYALTLRVQAATRREGLTVLRGMECEVVPADRYAAQMWELRERHGFEYWVGSVHHVNEIQIDGPITAFEQGVRESGSLDALAVDYYRTVARMVEALRPEVVGHLDLVCKHAPRHDFSASAEVRAAATDTLDVIAAHGSILDINTAGFRKGLGRPYVAPWLLQLAQQRGIGVCFGDDSHRVSDVAAGLDEARAYLLANGIGQVMVLARG